MILYCIPTCSTCAEARAWLKVNGYDYVEYDLKVQVPDPEEMLDIIRKSGLALRKFFNTSGVRYRELNLSKRLAEMDEARQVELLLSDGMLMKRPLLIHQEKVLVGFDEKTWEKAL